MTLAVTGATGFVGRALLDRAAHQGTDIRALTRRAQSAREGVRWIGGDLADHRALADLAKGADVLIHVAGVVSAPDKNGFQAGNVVGTGNVIQAAQEAGVRRFVFVSSLSAREPQLSLYGASKARAEQLVKDSGLDWVIVRPPAIYGPYDTDMFELFRLAKWGVVPMPPAGRSSIIHVDDLVRLLLALARQSDVTGVVFEPDDARAGGWTHKQLGRAIGLAVSRRVWVPNLPQILLRQLSTAEGALRGGGAKLTRDRVNYMLHPDWVARRERQPPEDLWRPKIGGEEGFAATARWYREQGWL